MFPFLFLITGIAPVQNAAAHVVAARPAEIPANDDKIILCHLFLFREDPRIESPKIPMAVAGYVNHFAPQPFPEK